MKSKEQLCNRYPGAEHIQQADCSPNIITFKGYHLYMYYSKPKISDEHRQMLQL